MLDSSPRIPRSAPVRDLEWEETTFTRPMRSPFSAKDEPRARTAGGTGGELDGGPLGREAPAASVDVALEEAALFEPPPLPALRRVSTAPPPRRHLRADRSAPPFQEEETVKREQPHWLLHVLASERDSTRLRAAASSEVSEASVDLAKTVEEPTFGAEIAKLRRR